MNRKIRTILKKGERRFVRDIQEIFEQRRAELLEQLKRLELRRKEGWGYRRVRRRGYNVRAHKVRAHWVTLPVRNTRR